MGKSKPLLRSKSIVYTLVSAIGVIITALLVDERFTAEIGTIGMLVLYVVDKSIHGYLRTITTVPIETKVQKVERKKTQHEKRLDMLNEPLQSDDDYLENI